MTSQKLIFSKFLLSNDDGYDSLGIVALQQKLQKKSDVILCAPLMEQSAKGHSFTLLHPLRLKQIAEGIYAVNGTPADCVYLAVNSMASLCDIVISGINQGANLGTDIYYSGTVAAAREGAIQGRKAIAFSVLENCSLSSEQRLQVYENAAQVAVYLIEVLLQLPWKSGLYWNVNFPATQMLNLQSPEKLEMKILPLGVRKYHNSVIEKTDPRGHSYFWIGGPPKDTAATDNDCYWCEQGFTVLTPLQLVNESASLENLQQAFLDARVGGKF